MARLSWERPGTRSQFDGETPKQAISFNMPCGCFLKYPKMGDPQARWMVYFLENPLQAAGSTGGFLIPLCSDNIDVLQLASVFSCTCIANRCVYIYNCAMKSSNNHHEVVLNHHVRFAIGISGQGMKEVDGVKAPAVSGAPWNCWWIIVNRNFFQWTNVFFFGEIKRYDLLFQNVSDCYECYPQKIGSSFASFIEVEKKPCQDLSFQLRPTPAQQVIHLMLMAPAGIDGTEEVRVDTPCSVQDVTNKGISTGKLITVET